MTVLFLISSEGYYGVENMLLSLAMQLARLGTRCVVGVFRNSQSPHTEIADEAQRQGLPVEVIPCCGKWDRKAISEIRLLLKKHSVDVVHTHGYKPDLYALAAIGRRRTALVATSHNWPSALLSMRMYAVLDRLALRMFDKVVVVSDKVGHILRGSGVDADKLAFIPNGVDLQRFANAAPKLRDELGLAHKPVVGFVGRLVSEKGGPVLIQAAKTVLATRPETRFVLVGDGPARQEWQNLAETLGIADNVIFTGARSDMPEVYASMDLVVLPSEIEAMPMCLLEAMAAGKTVIATSVGAVPRIVIPSKTGLLIEPKAADALASSMLHLLREKELSLQLANNGKAHVTQHFSAEAMASTYLGLYEEVLSERTQNKVRVAAWEMN